MCDLSGALRFLPVTRNTDATKSPEVRSHCAFVFASASASALRQKCCFRWNFWRMAFVLTSVLWKALYNSCQNILRCRYRCCCSSVCTNPKWHFYDYHQGTIWYVYMFMQGQKVLELNKLYPSFGIYTKEKFVLLFIWCGTKDEEIVIGGTKERISANLYRQSFEENIRNLLDRWPCYM